MKILFIAINIMVSLNLFSQYKNINEIKVGNFSLDTGAVYGMMGYESVKDIVADNNDIYILVGNQNGPYIIRYSTEGIVISTVTVGLPNVNYKGIFMTPSNIFIIGTEYLMPGGILQPKNVVVAKYNRNLVFISSNVFSAASDKLEFKSGVVDGGYLYLCVDQISGVSGTSAQLAKVDLTTLSTTSFYGGFVPDYVCSDYIFINGTNLYTLIKQSSLSQVYISTSQLSDISTQYLTPLNSSIPPYTYFAVNSTNLFGFFYDNNGIAVYKYNLSDFSNFVSSTNLQYEGEIRDIKATDNGVIIGYSKFNDFTSNSDYYFTVLDPNNFNVKNIFLVGTPENDDIRKISFVYSVDGSTAYISGETYICKTWGCDNDVRTVRFSNFDWTVNQPPLLTFPPDYVGNGGIEQGKVLGLAQAATFYIEYYDVNGDSPNYVKIGIRGEGDSNYTYYDMTCVSNCSPSQRMLFAYTTSFFTSGIYNYIFEAEDTSSKTATGYPTQFSSKFIVLKGFEGSFASNNKLISLDIPADEQPEYKLFGKGSDIYGIVNPNVSVTPGSYITKRIYAPSIIVKFSTSTDMPNRFYDFNFNWPYMNNNLGWFIYDAKINDSGKIEVIASSENASHLYDIFFATLTPQIWLSSITFSVDVTSTIATESNNGLPHFVNLYLKPDSKYLLVDNIVIVKCDNNSCPTAEYDIGKLSDFLGIDIKSISLTNSYIYTCGSYNYGVENATQTAVIFKINNSGVIESTFTFTLPSTIKGEMKSIIMKDNYLYAIGNFKTPVDDYEVLFKLDSNLNIVDLKLFNNAKIETFTNLVDAGNSIIVVGNYSEADNTVKTPLIVRIDTTTLSIIKEYKDIFNSGPYEIDDTVFLDNKLYYVQSGNIPYINTSNILNNSRYKMIDLLQELSDSRVNVTISLKDSNGNPLSNTKVNLIPIEEGKTNIAKAIIGYQTDLSGSVNIKALKNVPYFIAISTPGYSPTIREAFTDPYRRFVKVFTSPTNISYTFKKLTIPDNTYSVVISSVIKGLSIFGSIEYNNELVSLSVDKTTDSVVGFNFYGVPQIEPNKYKIDISIPDLLSYNQLITSSGTLYINFSSAVSPSLSYEDIRNITTAFKGLIVDEYTKQPIGGAKILLSTTSNNCMSYLSPIAMTNSDQNGKFAFNISTNSLGSTVCITIKKEGYVTLWNTPYLVSDYEYMFNLYPATYSVSGYITYNGIPLAGVGIEAGGYDNQSYNFSGNDSYYLSHTMSWVNGYAVTDSNGYFSISGLKDGNIAIRIRKPLWMEINAGNDGVKSTSDDIRIVISSAEAIPPTFPPQNICTPGKVWILNSSGTCLGITPYTFDISQTIEKNATLNLSVKYDVIGATDTQATVLIEEECSGEYCSDSKRVRVLIPLSSNLTSGTTNYVINLTSGTQYHLDLLSNKWAFKTTFDFLNFTTTDTINSEIILTRAGGLRVKFLKPDGSVFIPMCNYSGCRWPRIYLRNIETGYNYNTDFWVDGNDPNPVFEIPNLVPGRYSLMFVTQDYPPSFKDDVFIEAGKITDIRIKLQEGLFVKPNITSLAQPTTSYNYYILSLPSGFEMKRKNINNLLFAEDSGEKYVIRYDTISQSFEQKLLNIGIYDFYLVVASRYVPYPHNNETVSYRSFISFIGVEKGKSIQKDLQNPDYGSVQTPISNFSIYGSIGKSTLSGKIKGKNLVTEKDYGKIFAGDLEYLISLIPSVMLYDESGNLRAFSHSLMDSQDAFSSFETAIQDKSTTTLLEIFNSSSSYFIAGLPNGRYTAVFISPNYPPVTKEIFVNGATTFDINLDSETVISSNLIITVLDESSNPIKGASVFVVHKAFEKLGYTDDNGRYVFNNIPGGLYKLTVSKDGYITEGKKFSLGSETLTQNITLKQSTNMIVGRVYLSKFPRTIIGGGVNITAYNETQLTKGANYVPSIKTTTNEDGNYIINNVEAGSIYRVVATYPGKLTQTITVSVSTQDIVTNAEDIVFVDIPPQVDVKIKRYKNSLELYIESPKEIVNTPVCEYLSGRYTFDTFDETNASQLALVKLPNNVYAAKFNISTLNDYYTIKVKVGDVDKIEKIIIYDVKNDIARENYITDKIYLGGNIYTDAENDDYTGIEMDPGVFIQSTSSISTQQLNMIKVAVAGDNGLIGGFFSALPTVRTVRTAKGDVVLSDVIKEIMVSDIYDIELTNAQANKEFTLTLKYDKEKVLGDTSKLKIYQYDDTTKGWKEIKGTYTIDPMLGTVSVDILSLEYATEASGSDVFNPFIRKKLGMSAIKDGRFVPQNIQSTQTGRFAVFNANPPTGTSYSGSSFEIYNIPNPFDLKPKTIALNDCGGASWCSSGNYTTEGTVIKYHLPTEKSGHLKLVIYNIAGEKVRTIDEGNRSGGYIYYSEWNGRNDKNEKVASGVYLLITYLNGEKIGSVHKMAVIK